MKAKVKNRITLVEVLYRRMLYANHKTQQKITDPLVNIHHYAIFVKSSVSKCEVESSN